MGRGRDRRRRPRRGRGRRGDGARARPPPARPRSRAAPHALRRDLERGAVVPAPRPVRPRPPASLRPPPPRGVGRLRRGERGVRRRRSRDDAHGRRAGARARLPPRARARAWCARPGPTCGSRTSPTRRSADPTRSACCPPTWPRRCARRWAAVPAGFHTERWARGLRGVGARGARPRRRSRPTRRRSGPIPTRWPSSLRRRRHRARRRRARRARRRPQAAAAQRSHRPVEEHRARASTCTTRSSTPTPSGASASCSSPCSTGRASNLAEYLAYEQEVDQAAARVNERWATRDWQPVVVDTRDDYEQTIAGLHPLRRAAGEPGEGRPEPRGQGRPAAQPARRRGACSRPRRARTTSCATRCCPIHPYDIEQGAHALHAALDDARRRARRARDAAARARRGAHAADLARRAAQPGAAADVASASASSSAARPGRSVDHDVGADAPRAGSRPTPRRCSRRGASTPSRPSACSAANAGRSPASSPANAAAVRRGRGRRRSCPCRRAPAAAARPPCVPAAVPRARGAARPRRPTPCASAPRSGWSRQWTVTATSPLRSTSSPGSAASASSAARAIASTNGRTRSSTHDLAVDDPFEAVGADVAEPVDRRARRAGTPPGGRSPPPPCASTGTSRASAARAAGSGRAAAGSSTIGDSEPSKSTNSARAAGRRRTVASAGGTATMLPRPVATRCR